MDAASQPIMLNVVLSVTVISVLGVGLFSWDLAARLFPVWARVLIVGGLFTHLSIRTLMTITSKDIVEEIEEQQNTC